MKVLWHGFDRLDLAIKAVIPEELLEQLQHLRERAEQSNERQSARLGPGKLQCWVEPYGMKGGFRYQIETGHIGFRISFKANSDKEHWNIFACASNAVLISAAFEGAVAQLHGELAALGITPRDDSINRIDYAVDILLDELVLDPGLLIVPPGTKTMTFCTAPEPEVAVNSHVMKGGRIQSLTCGRMPGRQLILYDKVAEILQNKKLHMFDLWGLDPRKTNQSVMRIEVRAGKRELKERFALRTLEDVRSSIGDVFSDAMASVRLVAPGQGDTNFSRQASHMAWELARKTIVESLNWSMSGLTRGQVTARLRKQVSENAEQNIIAYSFRWAHASKSSEHRTRNRLLAALNKAAEVIRRMPESELNRRTALAEARLALED